MIHELNGKSQIRTSIRYLCALGITIACIAFFSIAATQNDGALCTRGFNDGGMTASDYRDPVDLYSYDGAGYIDDYSYMYDFNTATYTTFTTDAGGLDQVFHFTSIDPDWSYVQIWLGVTAGGFNVRIYADTNPTPTTDRGLYGSTPGEGPINIGTVTTGDFYVRFYSTAAAGNSLYIHTLHLNLVDNTAPTWRSDFMPATGTWYAANPALHIRFDEDCFLTSAFYDLNDPAAETDNLMYANIGATFWERGAWTMSASEWNGCGQGSNTLYFLVEQTATQPGSFNWVFNKDTVAPNVATSLTSSSHTTSSWSSDTSVDVSWTAATDVAPGSGIAGYCFSWSHGAQNPGTVVNNNGTTATSSALADGNDWYFNIRARDNVGQWSTTASIGPFWIDSHDPSITTVSSSSHQITQWSATTQITANWVATDGIGRGIDGYRTSWASSATDPGTSTTTTTLLTETSPALAQGSWYFNIRARDLMGFWSTNYSIGPFRIDTFAPDLPSLLNLTHALSTWLADTRVNVSWPLPDDDGCSGIAGYAYSWSNDHAQDPGTVNNHNNTLVSTVLGDGLWYLNIRVVDRVGHWSTNTSIGPFMIDTVFPAVSGPSAFNIEYGSTGNVISYNMTDLHPGSFIVYRNGAIYNSTPSWVSGEIVHISIDGMDPGTYNFTIVITDAAGNSGSHTVIVAVQGPANNLGDVTIYVVIAGGLVACVALVAVGVRKKRKAKQTPRNDVPGKKAPSSSEPSPAKQNASPAPNPQTSSGDPAKIKAVSKDNSKDGKKTSDKR